MYDTHDHDSDDYDNEHDTLHIGSLGGVSERFRFPCGTPIEAMAHATLPVFLDVLDDVDTNGWEAIDRDRVNTLLNICLHISEHAATALTPLGFANGAFTQEITYVTQPEWADLAVDTFVQQARQLGLTGLLRSRLPHLLPMEFEASTMLSDTQGRVSVVADRAHAIGRILADHNIVSDGDIAIMIESATSVDEALQVAHELTEMWLDVSPSIARERANSDHANVIAIITTPEGGHDLIDAANPAWDAVVDDEDAPFDWASALTLTWLVLASVRHLYDTACATTGRELDPPAATAVSATHHWVLPELDQDGTLTINPATAVVDHDHLAAVNRRDGQAWASYRADWLTLTGAEGTPTDHAGIDVDLPWLLEVHLPEGTDTLGGIIGTIEDAALPEDTDTRVRAVLIPRVSDEFNFDHLRLALHTHPDTNLDIVGYVTASDDDTFTLTVDPTLTAGAIPDTGTAWHNILTGTRPADATLINDVPATTGIAALIHAFTVNPTPEATPDITHGERQVWTLASLTAATGTLLAARTALTPVLNEYSPNARTVTFTAHPTANEAHLSSVTLNSDDPTAQVTLTGAELTRVDMHHPGLAAWADTMHIALGVLRLASNNTTAGHDLITTVCAALGYTFTTDTVTIDLTHTPTVGGTLMPFVPVIATL